SYTYAIIGPSGVRPSGAASPSDRPITYVSWFNAARFANWMANDQPIGMQGPKTTERGAYNLDGEITGNAVARNAINPNTREPPRFYIPTENEWYKAAFYSATLDDGAGGYYPFATQSDRAPGNVIGGETNQTNYITDGTGYSIYSVTQLPNLDLSQNYLT